MHKHSLHHRSLQQSGSGTLDSKRDWHTRVGLDSIRHSLTPKMLIAEEKLARAERALFIEGILFFIIKFLIIFAIATIIVTSVDLSFINKAITSLSAGLVGLTYEGAALSIGNSAFLVTNSCTGLISAGILAGLIFASRNPKFKKKLALFIFGAVILVLVNIPRIALVLLAAKSGYNAELVHELTWFLMSAVVLVIWYYGIKHFGKINDFKELI
ncbi:MAG: exosortase/archaeosortase family protein [Candidatus Diapherotrites archaeon]|nr:exosortase/archaeosortase family protein [Candidatus Diapherotrites archaeon]